MKTLGSSLIGLAVAWMFTGFCQAAPNRAPASLTEEEVVFMALKEMGDSLEQLQEQIGTLKQQKGNLSPSMLESLLATWGATYGAFQPILEVAFTNDAIRNMLPIFIYPMMSTVNMSIVPSVNATMGTAPVNVDAYELQRFLEKNPDTQIIDVRTPAEFAQLHIPGAINIPIQELNVALDRDPRLQRDRPVVTVCVSGVNGYVAALLAVLHGYPEVYNLENGIIGGWVPAGLPVVSSQEERAR